MKVKFLRKLHLILAAYIAPFVILVAITGGAYLLGFKGTAKKIEKFTINQAMPEDNTQRLQVIRDALKEHNIAYQFEYIKVSGNTLILRPTTRDFYQVEIGEDSAKVFLVDNDFLRSAIELHKGHGPKILKKVAAGFAGVLLLVTITGFFIALSNKKSLWLYLFFSTSGLGTIIALILI